MIIINNRIFNDRIFKAGSAILMALLLSTPIFAPWALAAKVGEPTPDFKGMSVQGKAVELSQLKGKFVVLEWQN